MNILSSKKIFFLIGLFSVAKPIIAEESLREMCRKDVAGVLLNHFDLWQLSKEKLAVLEKSYVKSKEQLTKAMVEHKKIEKEFANEKGTFDIKKVELRDISQAKLDSVQQKIKEIQSTTEESQKSLSESKNRYEKLKKESEKIFLVSERKGTEKSNLLLEVRYKSECPKYRAQCALKEHERKILKENILPLLDSKISCERYSNIQ